ncbi:class I SAM-dependent methyltransferase [Streptomyces sioyaensis]|uniref:SAM-dependent methyltransferase n=1 Tax=Streptomyces sioyaensis TaxID=67364 RepID=UPI0033C2FDDF
MASLRARPGEGGGRRGDRPGRPGGAGPPGGLPGSEELDRSNPSAREVGEWYDRFGGLYSLTMGDSMHLGMWTDGVRAETGELTADEMWEELTRAQDSWTDTLIDVVGLLPGQRMLDVGCGTGRPTVRIGTESGASVLGVTVSAGQVRAGRDRALKAGLSERHL